MSLRKTSEGLYQCQTLEELMITRVQHHGVHDPSKLQIATGPVDTVVLQLWLTGSLELRFGHISISPQRGLQLFYASLIISVFIHLD